jgi:ABC-type uncharacterized transport system substrate-binding protein
MQRREFIALLGGATVAWPFTAHSQRASVPVVGVLHTGSPEMFAVPMIALRKGLSEAGFVESQSVAIEYRWAHNDRSRLPELLADLIRRQVAVIAIPTNTTAALAAKAATTTIPVVFGVATDPVKAGLVQSLNRPGGNVTGIAGLISQLGAKRLGLLHELLPNATRFSVLVSPNNPVANSTFVKDVQSAAAAVAKQVVVVVTTGNASRDIDGAFAKIVKMRIEALLVGANSVWAPRRAQFATLAARHKLPAIYPAREFVDAGGLMSYGPNIADRYRQVGIYVGKILKGAKPADLPVMQAAKFELIINLSTAKALDLTIPPTLLGTADEVIE